MSPNRNRTILLVEDNANDVELTLRAFEKTSIASRIVVARDGEEAIQYLLAGGTASTAASNEVDGAAANRDPLPALVLLDIKLPKIDGLGVLRRLRADTRTRRLPVVVLTSSKEERDVITCYELGANSFVRKPIDFAEFIDAARQLSHYWLGLNEMPPGLDDGD
jgi:two-component system, response regulator